MVKRRKKAGLQENWGQKKRPLKIQEKKSQSSETEHSSSESTSDLSVMWKSFQCFLKLWQQTAWFSWSTTLSRRTVVFWTNSVKSFFKRKPEYISIFLNWMVFFSFFTVFTVFAGKNEKKINDFPSKKNSRKIANPNQVPCGF